MVFGEETDAVECDMKALVHSERVCVCVCVNRCCVSGWGVLVSGLMWIEGVGIALTSGHVI